MTHLRLQAKTKNDYEKLLTAVFIGIVISVGIFFLIAYSLGDGSVYGTGYEFGKLIGSVAGKIQTSITKGIKLSGALLALFVSFKRNRSIWWAMLHAVFGWLYILYVLCKERGEESH